MLTGSGFYGFDVVLTAVERFRDGTKLVKHVWWYHASAAYRSIIAPVILDDTSSAWESPLCPHTLMRLSFIWIVDFSKHKLPHIKQCSRKFNEEWHIRCLGGAGWLEVSSELIC